jgi:hypothetical protein
MDNETFELKHSFVLKVEERSKSKINKMNKLKKIGRSPNRKIRLL